MPEEKLKFNMDLPEGIFLMEASFDFILQDCSAGFTVKICDEGGGAFLKIFDAR